MSVTLPFREALNRAKLQASKTAMGNAMHAGSAVSLMHAILGAVPWQSSAILKRYSPSVNFCYLAIYICVYIYASFFPPLLPLSLQFFLVLAHTLIMFPSPSRTQLHVIYDLKLFRELMCCRSRTSCSRPRLSLVSWCRACGPIFRVLLVPFIALVPLFPWPSRSSFWAFFVVVVCVLGSCSGLTLSRCIPPHFILPHQPHLCPAWSTLVLLFWATCMSPWVLWVTLSNTRRPISHVLGLLTPSTGSFEVISSDSPPSASCLVWENLQSRQPP